MDMQTVLLLIIVLCTLVLPFTIKKVEEELEIFLFVMGICAASVSNIWSWALIKKSLTEPIEITLTVAVVGIIFTLLRKHLKKAVDLGVKKLGGVWFVFAVVLFLGLASSLITAIVAAIILSEIISLTRFSKEYESKLTVYACYAIGLGAVLTPVGEPLSTIVISTLRGAPHHADFFFLLTHLGEWVIPGVIISSAFAAFGARKERFDYAKSNSLSEKDEETSTDMLVRAGKVYIFVMALVYLGGGLTPLAQKYILPLHSGILFWANSVSAILDNATLAAAEITPTMTTKQIEFILMGLLISGGMLIQGNIPNIISASKLRIKSKIWARTAVPFGLVLMLIYFILMQIIVK